MSAARALAPQESPSIRYEDALFPTLHNALVITSPSKHSGTPDRLATTVAALITAAPTISPTLSVGAAGELFQKHDVLYYIPVVERGQPVGLLCRLTFMNIFLSRYGRELYSRKPVSTFMSAFLSIEQTMLLEDASRLVTSSVGKRFDQQAFIITDQGQYCGLGWIMDLLEKITDLRVKSAQYANPLTLLPGNVPIAEHIEALIHASENFAVAYCDLDHFKPYNDVYGYDRGDHVIRDFGNLLKTHTEAGIDFVGHVGGDDFIVVFQSPDWQIRCEKILQAFAESVPSYYHTDDRNRQGLWSQDRQGEKMFFSLLSVSIGVVQPDSTRCRSHHDVATLATEAKHQAKREAGNTLFIDRRR